MIGIAHFFLVHSALMFTHLLLWPGKNPKNHAVHPPDRNPSNVHPTQRVKANSFQVSGIRLLNQIQVRNTQIHPGQNFSMRHDDLSISKFHQLAGTLKTGSLLMVIVNNRLS